MHYTGTIWRPPYEAYSLLIQVTAGCTHHSCKFCTLYEDLPFKFKLSPFSEVKADLAEASKYYQKISRIFFTGANPFVLSTEKLKTLAKMVREYCPFYKTIGCFARITDIMPKSLEELKELRALGYDGITIGVETGDDESLIFMNKGFQSKDVLEQCRKLDEAGISYNFFYLTGIEISYIPRDLITVIFYYQISLNPLKTQSLSQVSFPLLFPLRYIVPPVFTNSDKGKNKGKKII